MEHRHQKPHQILKNKFLSIHERNPEYSLRAFSRDSGISSGRMSELLKNERQVTSYHIDIFSHQNIFSKDEIKALKSASEQSELNNYAETVTADEIIEDPDYFRIITAFECFHCNVTIEKLSTILGLDIETLKFKIDHLVSLKMVEFLPLEKAYKLLTDSLTTTDEISSTAIKNGHTKTLQDITERLWDTCPSKRYISTLTLAIDSKNVDALKKHISSFEHKFRAKAKRGVANQVYELTLAFMPTRPSKIKLQ